MSNEKGPELGGEIPDEKSNESEESRRARVINILKKLQGSDQLIEELTLSHDIQERYKNKGPQSILPEEKQFMGKRTFEGALFLKNRGRKPTQEEIQKIGENYLETQAFYEKIKKDETR